MLPKTELDFINRQLKKIKCKNLAEYYKSDKWQYARTIKRDNPQLRCSICNNSEGEHVQMELHHNTYRNLGEENGYELEWLCSTCHQELHEKVTYLVQGHSVMSFVAASMKTDIEHMNQWIELDALKKQLARTVFGISNETDGE